MTARQSHAVPAQRHITWTYAELAVVLADIRKTEDIQPSDGVMIVSKNRAPILAQVGGSAWSLAMNPRLSALAFDRLRAHGGAHRVSLHWLGDLAHPYADVFAVRDSATCCVGPFNCKTAPERVEAKPGYAAEAA
jgi:hypothetical protein